MNALKESRELDRQDRIAWQNEQEAIRIQHQANTEKQLAELRDEVAKMRASMAASQVQLLPAPTPPPPPPPLPAPTPRREEPPARAEEVASPFTTPLTPISQASYHSQDLPAFVEGSSSRPMSMPLSPSALPAHISPRFLPTPVTPRPPPAVAPFRYAPVLPSPSQPPPNTLLPVQSASIRKELLPHRTDALPSPAQTPVVTPAQASTGRRKRRTSPSGYDDDDADSESDTEGNPKRRKNGHDSRCLTIQVSFLHNVSV